jgi:hypothetical protein
LLLGFASQTKFKMRPQGDDTHSRGFMHRFKSTLVGVGILAFSIWGLKLMYAQSSYQQKAGSLPLGGDQGDILTKSSNQDYDYRWDRFDPSREFIERFDSVRWFDLPQNRLVWENAQREIENPVSIFDGGGSNSGHDWVQVPGMNEGRVMLANYNPAGYISMASSPGANGGYVDISPYAVIDHSISGPIWARWVGQSLAQGHWRQSLVLKYVGPGNFFGVDIGYGGIGVFKAVNGVKEVIAALQNLPAANPLYTNSSSTYDLMVLMRKCHTDYASSGYLIEVQLYERTVGYAPISTADWNSYFTNAYPVGISLGNTGYRLYSIAAGAMP